MSDKRILFQQATYLDGMTEIRNASWRYFGGYSHQNGVYVELRNYDEDYIIESFVIINGTTIVNERECKFDLAEHELIRVALFKFDTLVSLHLHPLVAEVMQENYRKGNEQ